MFTLSLSANLISKNKKILNYLLLLFTFLFSLSSILSINGCKRLKKATTVKIALAVPLTGDIAAMGQGMKRGAEMAIEDGNKREGIKNKGIKLELMPLDDRGDPKESISAATRISSDANVAAIIGHLNSGCSVPSSRYYNRRGITMISPASTNPKLTQQGFKNVFRVCTTDDVQGSFAANYIYDKLKIKRVVVIHDKTQYGKGIALEFKKQFIKNKGKILSFDGIDTGDKDFKALLTRVKAKLPQALYYGGMYSEGGLITKQAKELGLNIPLVGADGIFTPEYFKIGGSSTEGDYATMIGAPPVKLASARKFIKRFKKKYKNIDMQPYDAYTYDSTMLIIAALEKVGTDRTKITNYVSKVKYNGIMGLTSFDSKGDTLNKIISVYKVGKGNFIYQD